MRSYNGTSFFDHKPIKATIELDACLTGFGGRWGNCVYHVPIEKEYKNLAITQLETLNILVALRLFASYWHRKKVHVRCDNLAAVQVLTSGKTQDPFLAACARDVWMVAAQADIQVKYSHIPGSKNEVADPGGKILRPRLVSCTVKLKILCGCTFLKTYCILMMKFKIYYA